MDGEALSVVDHPGVESYPPGRRPVAGVDHDGTAETRLRDLE